MNKPRLILGVLLAAAAALPVVMPGSADARVFVGIGLGFPFFGYGAPFYAPYPYPPPYYPPPVVYAPPPPVVYAPPPAYGTTAAAAPAASTAARCVTRSFVCPLHYEKPLGTACSCPDSVNHLIPGRVG